MTNLFRLCRESDIPSGDAIVFAVDGRQVAVFNAEGAFYAFLDLCPHQGVRLADGDFANNCITCPLHKWQFDVRDGTRSDDQTDRENKLQTFPVRVENGDVLVALPARLEATMARVEDVMDVGTVADFPVGHVALFSVDDRNIVIVNDEGRLYAIDDCCPHMDASLASGEFGSGTVRCPMHNWVFSLEDGGRCDSRRDTDSTTATTFQFSSKRVACAYVSLDLSTGPSSSRCNSPINRFKSPLAE